MRQRFISAGILVALIAAVVLLSLKFSIFIDIFVAFICAADVFEFNKAVKTLHLYQMSFISIAFAFIYPMLLSYGMSTVICYIYVTMMLGVLVFFHSKISFKEFAYTFSMTMIITVSLSLIVSLKDLDNKHSTLYFVFSMASPWLADAGAYFSGVFFGKHKLCPKISPKKTIEGAVGGVLFCIMTSCGVIFIFQWLIYNINVNYINVILISLCGALLSILGDLSFSVIKRSYSVKDYGDLIPGHGGILDRFDSVICFVPFLYIVLNYLPIVLE